MNEQAPPDNQDLEHRSTPETRVPNKGVKVQPPMVDRQERHDFEKEDEKAQETIEEFEESVRNQVPG